MKKMKIIAPEEAGASSEPDRRCQGLRRCPGHLPAGQSGNLHAGDTFAS